MTNHIAHSTFQQFKSCVSTTFRLEIKVTVIIICLLMMHYQGFVNLSMSIMASGQKLLAPPQVEPLLLNVFSYVELSFALYTHLVFE